MQVDRLPSVNKSLEISEMWDFAARSTLKFFLLLLV